MTRAIFHPADDGLLNYLEEEGMSIEPEYFLPTVPMVLINGADGIGTGKHIRVDWNLADSAGWSTQIPNYNPLEIVENLQRLMKGEEVEKMTPWFRGFKVCSLLIVVADGREQSKEQRPTSTRSAVSLTRLMIPPSRSPSCQSESGPRTSRRCWRR